MDNQLTGRVALVTGANHGIGAATAEALARVGARVFVTYLRLPEPRRASGEWSRSYDEVRATASDEVIARIRADDSQAAALEADLADAGVPADLFNHAEDALGPVEILVNNADHCSSDTFLPEGHAHGLSTGGETMHTLTAESFDAHAAVNARAPALLMSEFARRHLERGGNWGRIVNVSTDGSPGFPTEVSYGATKHALESFTRAGAHELGPLGITVNCVSPGPIQTGYISPEKERSIAETTPLRRVGRPNDVADVIAFLCSDAARWLTGQTLFVGGGWRMI